MARVRRVVAEREEEEAGRVTSRDDAEIVTRTRRETGQWDLVWVKRIHLEPGIGDGDTGVVVRLCTGLVQGVVLAVSCSDSRPD